ncbi:unnamed protein product [Chrysodeixis includens]|uniref:BRCA1-associated ATM activator 1 n=1 Tax=Chrysodeixis includens TaxID=689277 RepID=A0A9P0BQ35_CHRIL|nr:unnamed protein product [Chrysodeixis includens]
MDFLRAQNKTKLLFEKLVEPNYVLNSYYADGLINKISQCTDPDILFMCRGPLISDLVAESLNYIDNVHNTVKVFLIRVLAHVSQKELHFAKIFPKQGERIRAGFEEVCSPKVNPSIRVAYMEVALSIVKHNSGMSWLLQSGVWKEILNLSNEKSTVFVERQICKFMAEFLWKLNDLDDVANVRLITGILLQGISKHDLINVQSLTDEQEDEICESMRPSLDILLAVASKDNRIQTASHLMSILIKEYKINSYLYVATERIRRDDTTLSIVKLLFWLTLAKLFLAKPLVPGAQYLHEDFLEVAAANFNMIQNFVQRRSATLILDYCAACCIIWNSIWKVEDPEMVCDNPERQIKMRNQTLIVFIVPILVFVTYRKTSTVLHKERVSDYIDRILEQSCEHTARAAYAMRDLTSESDTMSIILHSVKKLVNLKEHFNDAQANFVFQALFHLLQEYNPIDVYGEFKSEEIFEETEEKNLVMTYVMDSVLALVTHRNIHWHESLEIVCLYNVVYNILQRPNLSCKFVVVSLKVIGLTVKKFLQPNLSLLMESKPGSAIDELGKLIYMKMQDRNWEIRDTALELLLVCTEISYIKFPSFQKQILENNLINLSATVAFNDYEAYVQVSALKCVALASRVNAFWEQLTAEYPDMLERLLTILRDNHEGIVRKEACNVLCDLYQNLKLTPTFKQTLYEHMVSATLTDFHWEVQISALRFWKIVYQSLLNGQGMLDGNFPPVTFSRESRKIVTLNESEIHKRLLKTLDELAAIGCLTVFVTLLSDDTEVEIMDATLTTSLELYEILNKYKVPESLVPREGDVTSVEELLCHIKQEKEIIDDTVNMDVGQNQENVIEDILNADDVNLLANIYERHMSLQSEKKETNLKPKVKLVKFASPYLFTTFIKNTDFKQIIDEKRIWNDGIRSYASLLDDVLGLYEDNREANSLDCY